MISIYPGKNGGIACSDRNRGARQMLRPCNASSAAICEWRNRPRRAMYILAV